MLCDAGSAIGTSSRIIALQRSSAASKRLKTTPQAADRVRCIGRTRRCKRLETILQRAERVDALPYVPQRGDNDTQADWGPAWELFPGNIAYVWHGALHAATVADSLVRQGFSIRAQIIWAKERLVIGCGDYSWQHEPCWYAVRSKGYWTGDRKQTTLWSISSGNQDCQTPHITQKPVECMRRPMQNNSGANQTVYDPFLGSGTTLIAAETIERVCLGMELEPRFVDVAIRRWQAFTGKDAVRLDDGKPFNDIAAEYPIAESARRRRSAKRRTSRTNKS
jgi:hypothetical protein